MRRMALKTLEITHIFHIKVTSFNYEHPTTIFYHLYTPLSPVTRGLVKGTEQALVTGHVPIVMSGI